MESRKAEDPHYKGRREEIAKILQYSRIGDLIKGITEGIAAQEIYKQKEEYDYINFTEANMAPGQHTYLYEEVVAKMLGNTIIPRKVIQVILNAYIKRIYTNADPPTCTLES